MNQPAHYYLTPVSEPIVCLLVDDYVWEVGEETCKHKSKYHGEFVMLTEVREQPVTGLPQARTVGKVGGGQHTHSFGLSGSP